MSCSVMVGGEFTVPVLLAVEVERVAAPLFAFEAALPAFLDLLRGPGIVDFVVVVAALVEPVMFGAVGPVVVGPVIAAEPAVRGPGAVFIDLLGRIVPRFREGRRRAAGRLPGVAGAVQRSRS